MRQLSEIDLLCENGIIPGTFDEDVMTVRQCQGRDRSKGSDGFALARSELVGAVSRVRCCLLVGYLGAESTSAHAVDLCV